MEAHLALRQPTQVNKITTSCEICNGPMTLSIAWKTSNKPLLTTHPRVSMKQERARYLAIRLRTQKWVLPQFCLLVLTQLKIHNAQHNQRHHNPPKQPEESQVNEPDVGQEEKDNLGNIKSNPCSQPDLLASITTEQENENPIHTLGEYSRPSHEGNRNTIELPDGNNVVLLRSDTICMDSFQRLTSKFPHHGIDIWHKVQIFYDHVNPAKRRTIDQSAGGKLHDKNAKESLTLIEDLALYDNESYNDPRDFGPHDTQYFMENPEQAFVDFASSRNDEAGGKWFTFKPEQNNLGDTYNPSWKSHPNFRIKIGSLMDIRNGFSDSTDIVSGSSGIDVPNLVSDVSALNRLSETLESLLLEPLNSFSDAKIVISCGREIDVHRCILSGRKKEFNGSNNNDSRVSDKRLSAETSETLWQRRLLDILDKASSDDILVILSVANICGKSCEELLSKCIDILVKSTVDYVTLDKALPEQLVKQIIDSRFELGLDKPGSPSFPDKHIKRVHRALDSDDVELVTMLLREGHTTLDGSCALHYAVAYADAKTTTELLDLALADVNHKNSRGFSVLHIAAMRKEPNIIVSLLTKGARPADLTPDGRKALQISKRLTRAVDYYKSTEEGKECGKGRLCIEILEQAERRNPLLGEASASLATAGDDLRVKLLYLENRGTEIWH
nr:BTB/POZ domain and ankyrin repeat-containing protein NPR1 [Tanacetum cinerariifolium]